jgi:hypothetical protein
MGSRAKGTIARRSCATTLLLSALFCLCTGTSFAQQSRAEEIAQAQAEKSTRLTPNTPSGMERALDWFEDHFTDPNTAYLTFGSVYPTGGFAPGVAVRRAFGQARANVGAALSIRGYKLVHGALRFPELAGRKLQVETKARWVDATQVPFSGVGGGSIRDDRVNYRLQYVEAGGTVAFVPVSWYRIGAGAATRRFDEREGLGRRPSIETRHTATTAPGLFSDPRYVEATAFTAIDWRESPGYTRSGGLYSVALTDFRDRGDRFSFRRVDVDLRQYIPVLKEQWVFVVRGLAEITATDAGQVIPYYLLPSLGGAQTLRGYPDFRFQDKHMLLVSAEYRWLPSRVVDMAIFADSGKVVAERRDLDLNGLKTSYGIGIRFHGPTFTPLRVDVARGDEGIRAHVTGSVTF